MLTFPKKASTYFLKFTFREKKIIKIQGCTRKEYVIIFLKFFSQELFEGMITHLPNLEEFEPLNTKHGLRLLRLSHHSYLSCLSLSLCYLSSF